MENKELKNKKVGKKKKFTLKKVKKVFVNLFNAIGNKVKALWKKFKSLPNTTKYIIYVWAIIFILIVVLILVSNSNNGFLKDYKNLEKALNAGALDYVETNSLYPVKDNKLKLDLEFLLEDNYVYAEDVKDKTCSGFALVHYNDETKEYVVSSYINCEKYTTEGYNDYK